MIIKEFYSKRNKVYLVEGDSGRYIEKHFSDRDSFYREIMYYEELKGLDIPKLLFNEPSKLLVGLEYLGEQTALSLVEDYEKSEDLDATVDLLSKIVDWIISFHRHNYVKGNGLSFSDLNLRNFILHENQISGVDLESISKGSLPTDIAKLLAMYLYYDPIKSIFKQTVKKFIIDKCSLTSIDSSLISKIEFEELIIKERRGIR